MNKKGFTLIELLAVITILLVLSLIVGTSVTKMVKDSKENLSQAQMKLIESAAEAWAMNNINKLPEAGNCGYITLKNLYDEGLLDSKVINPKNNKKISNYTKVKINSRANGNGDPILNFEVDPESINGCTSLLQFAQSSEQTLLNGSTPVLDGSQFVPVVYDGDDWVIVEEEDKWYDYENQWWANAVILTKTAAETKEPGDIITVDGDNSDALAMLVWIPRYEYKIEGTYGTHTDGTAGTQALPGEIKVNFISKTTTTPSEGYIIHPAFTFGSEELSGIWVGKFETSILNSSTTLGCGNESCEVADNLRILPNVNSKIIGRISNYFFVSRSISRNNNIFGINKNYVDTHMAKNVEWGAVAYLSQSIYGKYGNSDYVGASKEIYINNSSESYTGRSGGNTATKTIVNETYTDQTSTSTNAKYGFYTYDGYLLSYNTNTKTSTRDMTKGTGASTTGNIYGIYDMSGGLWESIMAVLKYPGNGVYYTGRNSADYSGFIGRLGNGGEVSNGLSFPDTKYFDVYKIVCDPYPNDDECSTVCANAICNGSTCNNTACNGDAREETMTWYTNYGENSLASNTPWARRGGSYFLPYNYHSDSYKAVGLFSNGADTGGSGSNATFRMVFANISQ